MATGLETNEIKCDWLMLADAAQVANGKLFALGAGWDRIAVQRPLPVPQVMAIAAAIRIPWNQTNIKHDFSMAMRGEGGKELWKTGGQLEIGRAAGTIQGQDQRLQLALGLTLNLEQEGEYTVEIDVDGRQLNRAWFYVSMTPAARAEFEKKNTK